MPHFVVECRTVLIRRFHVEAENMRGAMRNAKGVLGPGNQIPHDADLLSKETEIKNITPRRIVKNGLRHERGGA